MIQITISPTGMTLGGHARAAPYGYDIVCAAVSALVQTFEAGAEEFTPDTVEAAREAATGQIRAFKWPRAPSKELKTLIDTTVLGLIRIASEYPENLTVEIIE